MTQRVYQNQGGIRNKPLTPKLLDLLTSVGDEANVYFDVQSGGQSGKHTPEAYKKPGGWTGSHRHDDGNAADLKAFTLNSDGSRRYLSMSNPDDQKVWGQVVRLARAGGATGIGAGEHYMGDQTAHIGFGKPAVWGDGQSSAGAPKWLKTAYEEGAHLPPLSIPASASMAPPVPQIRPASLSIPSRTPNNALDATGMLANGVAPTPEQVSAFYPGAPVAPPAGVQRVRAITVNPDGSGVPTFANMPSSAMYGNLRAPNSPAAHAPSYSDFSTNNGSPVDERVASLAAPKMAPRLPTPQAPPPAKVTFTGNGLNSPQTAFQKANQDALVANLPFGIGAAAQGIGNLAGLITNPKYGPVPSVTAAPALGTNMRPAAPTQTGRPTAQQMAAINAVTPPLPSYSPTQTGRPTAQQLAAINDVSGVTPPAVPPVPRPYPIAAKPTAPVPRPVPSYRLPIVPTAPQPTFPSQVWNAATTAVNHSPVGHIAQLLTGKPVTGGLLAMLQGTPIQAGRLINGGVLSQPQTAFTASQAAAGSPIALASSGGGGLAGGSLFDRNAQLPGSMDNRRWAGDGY